MGNQWVSAIDFTSGVATGLRARHGESLMMRQQDSILPPVWQAKATCIESRSTVSLFCLAKIDGKKSFWSRLLVRGELTTIGAATVIMLVII
ncbi:hypothetical protein X742_32385 [Mesorhizobium sp. LNHC232B00]|nr:hypothetical protein X742_32385 [Mesorhizobium sp. LNHC232B00]